MIPLTLLRSSGAAVAVPCPWSIEAFGVLVGWLSDTPIYLIPGRNIAGLMWVQPMFVIECPSGSAQPAMEQITRCVSQRTDAQTKAFTFWVNQKLVSIGAEPLTEELTSSFTTGVRIGM